MPQNNLCEHVYAYVNISITYKLYIKLCEQMHIHVHVSYVEANVNE